MFLRPPFLVPCDTAGIVAPARKISPEEVAPAIHIFESWGLKVIKGRHLHGTCNQFSGTDAERAADMNDLLANDEVKAIFMARGGYGCVRIADRIDFSLLQKQPKWIVGFSDITVFHAHVHALYGTETLHAAMPVNMQAGMHTNATLESLHDALFGKTLSYHVPPHPFNRAGRAKGILTGGNLSVLYSIAGSVSDADTKGKILFIEDLDEYLYHIDRMMLCLQRAGKLAGLKGLIVGGMSRMNDNQVPFGKDAYEIVKEAVNDYAFPVCFGFPAGHTEDNRALFLGREISLEVSDRGAEISF